MSIDKLYECIQRKKVNNSHAREAIYRVLMESKKCLTVADIRQKLQDTSPRKVSLNTIYRHLTLFTECALAVIVQDNFKKSYYVLTTNKAHVFTLCTKCNEVSIIGDNEQVKELIKSLKSNEFITVHRRCKKCEDKMI